MTIDSKENTPTIYVRTRTNPGAIDYYRVMIPTHALGEAGLVQILHDDYNPLIPDEKRMEGLAQSQIFWSHAISSFGWGPIVAGYSHLPPYLALDSGRLIVRTRVFCVTDLDDDYFDVDPTNPAFKDWGLYDTNGQMYKPGTIIKGTTLDRQEFVMWDDGRTTEWQRDRMTAHGFGDEDPWEITKVQENWARLRKLFADVGLLTTTNELLKSSLSRVCDPSKIYVYPNCLRFEDYIPIDLKPHPDEVWLLWQGGGSHNVDLLALREPLAKVLASHPNVRMFQWGPSAELYPGDPLQQRISHVSWVNYPAFKLRLAAMGHDINLCPLAPTHFNDCKSAIKWYESSALGRPVATLASNFGAYGREIQDGYTGMLYNNGTEFVEKLSALIENADLRERLHAGSVRWLKQNRDPATEACKLWSAIQEARARKDEPYRELIASGA